MEKFLVDSPDYSWLQQGLSGSSIYTPTLSATKSIPYLRELIHSILELMADSYLTKPIITYRDGSLDDKLEYVYDWINYSGFQEIIRYSLRKCLEHGRFVTILNISDGMPPTMPVNHNNISAIEFSHFLPLSPQSLVSSDKSKDCYEFSINNEIVLWHKSRCLHFSQYSAIPPIESWSQGKVLETTLLRFLSVSNGALEALKGANILLWKVGSLWELIESGDGDKIKSRMASNKESLEELSIIVVDQERESLDYLHKDLTGIIDIYKTQCGELGLITSMPESVLWGRTGDSTGLSRNKDLIDYENKIRPRRYRILSTPVLQLATLAFSMLNGKLPKDYKETLKLEFEPFAQEPSSTK
jgi:hypothetical protein